METIHINLVAYCDGELQSTLNNIYETAKHPERVFVGVVNQDDEVIEFDNSNVQIITIKPEDSDGYGACRKICQDKLYNGEDYYFQIAPHSRLAQNWDETLINYYNKKEGKHILVRNPSSYDTDTDKKEFLFHVDGVKDFHTHAVFHYKQGKDLQFDDDGMRKTYTFFAGTIFAKKDWLESVPYDEKIFLYGEEPDLNLRTFGEGYDAWIFDEEVVWHLWGRKNRKSLGHIREKETYNQRNYNTKKYIFEKLLKRDYERQDEFFELMHLDYNSLHDKYQSLIGGDNA